MLRLSVSLAVLLSMLAPLLVPAVSAKQVPNVSTPEAAAVFYSQLEAAGSFSEIYRYLHPDAQNFIPEAAVVGWYANEFAPNGPGVITVTGVQMMSWTWEVTGTTYPNTAVVSFRQPFANGTVVEDVVRLVEHKGEWRWFFGRSRAFVDEQIAKYGGVPVASGDQCAGAAEWWAETYPRLFPAQYYAHFYAQIWNAGTAGESYLLDYADMFSHLYEAQARIAVPPAAATLHADFLAVFQIYEQALNDFADAASGQTMPGAEVFSLSAAAKGVDAGSALLQEVEQDAEVFLATCDPLVVFVSGMGEDLPIGVLPGEVGPRVPVVDCSMFATAAEAQRFFEAAKPGDPHRLDPNNDGLACR